MDRGLAIRHLTRHLTTSLNSPPWLTRGVGHRGQTLLTNIKDPVFYHTPEGAAIEIGVLDRCYRLYRHSGLSTRSVADEDVVRYFHDEYTFLKDNGCAWLEFLPSTGYAERLDWNALRLYGSGVSTQWGPMWVVPRKYYERTTHVD